MKKVFSFFFALSLLLSLCICSVEAVSLPYAEVGSLRASDYFITYTVNATSSTKGKVDVDIYICTKNAVNTIGATKIIIQEKNGTLWTNVATKNGTTYNGLLGSNTDTFSTTYTYTGTSGKTYRAVVTIYAKDALGDDSRSVTTNSVVAK